MERNIFCLLSIGVVLLGLNNLSLAGEYCQDQKKDYDNSAGGIKIRKSQQLSDLSTDFEVGSQNLWMDESQTGVRWKIEDINSSWELNNPAPKPPSGRNYMRVDRGATLSFGVAVLRSPTVQIPPSSYNNISMSFDFWIRSKWPQFTNLELYLNENGNERLLVSLWNYSDINNRNWVSYPVSFSPLGSGSEFSLAFYAYCGTDVVDAVAIDNIRWIDALPTTTSSPVTQSTTQERSTTVSTKTTTASTLPSTTETITDETTITSTESPTAASTITKPALTFPSTRRTTAVKTTMTSTTSPTTTDESPSPSTIEETTIDETTTTELPTTPIAVCGGSFTATEEKKVISSPNYPNFYSSNEVCEYNITTANPSGKIRLEIVDFEMEASHDSLTVLLNYQTVIEIQNNHTHNKVYDGMTTESPKLLEATGYPGYNVPGHPLQLPAVPYSVNSTGPAILIVHYSDYSEHGSLKGWLANFVEFVD